MRKVHIIAQAKDISGVLEHLHELGVVHVEHVSSPSGDHLAHIADDVARLDHALNVLRSFGVEASFDERADRDDLLAKVETHISNKAAAEEDAQEQHVFLAHWEAWGDFDPAVIRSLEEEGVHVVLAELSPDQLELVDEDVLCQVVTEDKVRARCVLVAREKKEYPFPSLVLPEQSLTAARKELAEVHEVIAREEKALQDLACHWPVLQKALVDKKNELEFLRVKEGLGCEEGLEYLQGFCPAEEADALEKKAARSGWGISIVAVTDEDNVPTLVRMPRWAKAIDPIFKLMNIVPGYEEFDISMIFLPFFAVFTGILIGDGGYGILFLLAAGMVHWKMGKTLPNKQMIHLLYILGMSITFWGALTGTFFGQAWLKDIASPLLPWLTDNNNVMLVCFTIGAVHLTVAHVWRAILRWPTLAVIGELGLALLIWPIYFLVMNLILNISIPPAMTYVAVAGLVMALFFIRRNKNIFLSVVMGISDMFGSLIGMFTDVISYIRLFAVGLSSLAIADAFNTMASDIVSGMGAQGAVFLVIGIAIAAVILLIGHGLNVILAVMGVVVHGIRLNILEFSSHLGLEWKGHLYQPFGKIKE